MWVFLYKRTGNVWCEGKPKFDICIIGRARLVIKLNLGIILAFILHTIYVYITCYKYISTYIQCALAWYLHLSFTICHTIIDTPKLLCILYLHTLCRHTYNIIIPSRKVKLPKCFYFTYIVIYMLGVSSLI